LKCLEKGVRLITIFEDEWKHKPNQCKSILLSNLGKYNQKIYARNCQITNLNKIVFNQLCNQYHLQGSNNLGIVFYGLEFENEIVAAMSLGRHHRNKNIITLDRLFFKSNVQILGGASKLFKQCEKWAIEHNYKQIITWSDNRWSQGDIYEKLGFTLNENLPPDYSYVDIKKPYKRISKQSQKKSNTGCKDMTEKQWSLENGLARIWDCGKKRWIKYI
jgi:GNAT superfamily N-acetyltransferase